MLIRHLSRVLNGVLFALVLCIAATPAFAQDAVTIPWGAWLSDAATFLISVVVAAAAWGLRQLPAQIVSILMTMRVEQLLEKAISYGINAVAEASRDKVLTVPVANKVLAETLQYALDKMPAAILSWIGGADQLRSMIIARLKIEDAGALK